jgi:hypothetical protein
MTIDFTDNRTQMAVLHTPVEMVYRRTFPVGTAHQGSVNPRATNPIQCGEFLELSADGKEVVRGADDGTGGPGDGLPAAIVCASAATCTENPSWMVWYEVGGTDAQVLGTGNGMVPILFLNGFEIDTEIFINTSLAIGKKVFVGNVTNPRNAAVSLRGLVCDDLGGAHLGTDRNPPAYCVGRITKLPADNGGLLRVLVHSVV